MIRYFFHKREIILCPWNSFFPSLKINFFLNFPNFIYPHILKLFLFVPLGALLIKCLYTIKYFKPNQTKFLCHLIAKNTKCLDYVYFYK